MGVQRGLTAVDISSVEHAKAGLCTMDTKIKRCHMHVIDLLDGDTEIEREGDVMDEHESRVAHVSVSLKELCSTAKPTIKTESKELDVLR